MIQLYNSTQEYEFADTDMSISIDGAVKEIKPGGIVEITPGESITIPSRLFHKFWAKEGDGKVLIGEVSSVNDDYSDNVPLEDFKRFTEIEEDEEPLYLLYDDYKKYLSRH